MLISSDVQVALSLASANARKWNDPEHTYGHAKAPSKIKIERAAAGRPATQHAVHHVATCVVPFLEFDRVGVCVSFVAGDALHLAHPVHHGHGIYRLGWLHLSRRLRSSRSRSWKVPMSEGVPPSAGLRQSAPPEICPFLVPFLEVFLPHTRLRASIPADFLARRNARQDAGRDARRPRCDADHDCGGAACGHFFSPVAGCPCRRRQSCGQGCFASSGKRGMGATACRAAPEGRMRRSRGRGRR